NQPTSTPFSVVSNPEFLREGAAIEDFMRPNRVVIGAEDPQAIAIMKDLYNPLYLIETPFVLTNVVSAEMIKYASNAFLATKISFINEIAGLCEAVGADVHEVARGMGLDNRIGRKFLHPGPGFGGSCFPKDTHAVVKMAGERGVPARIVQAAIEVNRHQVGWMVEAHTRAAGGCRWILLSQGCSRRGKDGRGTGCPRAHRPGGDRGESAPSRMDGREDHPRRWWIAGEDDRVSRSGGQATHGAGDLLDHPSDLVP